MNRSLIMLVLFISVALFSLNAQNTTQDPNIFYHTIERGQTVYSIATMYGVSIDDIYRLNPESKESIKAGSRLRIPQREASVVQTDNESSFIYHTIQPRETLYRLTVIYNITAEDILKANPGLSTSTFNAGKTIRIPPTNLENLPTTEQKEVLKLMDYKVKKRETIYRITRKFGITSNELIEHNPALSKGVKEGMILKIPVKTDELITTEMPERSEEEVNSMLAVKEGTERVSMIKAALLLPFNADQVIPSAATARFIEYYEGLLIAVDSLKGKGVSIELSVYDTGEGSRMIKNVLDQPDFKENNLIIGAVKNDQIALLADYARKNEINYVIPFTSQNDDVLTNPYIFQVNTPHSYLYSKASQAAVSLFKNNNIIIVQMNDGANEKEEYIQQLKMELKQQNVSFKEVSFNANSFIQDVEKQIDPNKSNVFIPTSGSLAALNNICLPLRQLTEEKPQYLITLYGYPEWQTYTQERLEDFYVLNTYIYTNFYADDLGPKVQSFYNKYKSWYTKMPINTFPKYGLLGFDTGYYFLNSIYRYGKNFEVNIDKTSHDSLQTGFNFQRVNNWGGFINTNIFIVHYKPDFTHTRTIFNR